MALVQGFRRLQFGFAAAGDETGAGAVVGDPLFGHGLPQEIQARVTRGTVNGNHGGAGHQGGGLPVPHHPAAGGEVEEAVVRAHVAVQHKLFGVVNQQAGGAVHDALGFAGGAGGVEDVNRVIRVDWGKGRCLTFSGFQGIVPGGDHLAGDRGFIWQLRYADHHFQGRQASDQFGKVVLAGKHLSAIAVAIHHDQRGGFDLAEAVVDGTNAEVRRRGAPDGAQAGGGEHAHKGFVAVGDHASHAVALLDAFAAQEGFRAPASAFSSA